MCNPADDLPDFVLHVLDHSSDVGYMRGRLADGGVLLSLKRAKSDIVFRHPNTKYDPDIYLTCRVSEPPRFMVPDPTLLVCSQSMDVEVSL